MLVLGDEIVTHGLHAAGRTRDVLGTQLPAWEDAYGATCFAPSRRVPDDFDRFARAITPSSADVIVTNWKHQRGRRRRAAVAWLEGQLVSTAST